MGRRFGYPVLLALVMLAMLAGVGAFTYNLGLAHGAAVAGTGAIPAGAVPVAYWPRPWGFGFGFFPFFPFFILFWFFIVRGLFWRGRWGGRGCGIRRRAARVRRMAPPRPRAAGAAIVTSECLT